MPRGSVLAVAPRLPTLAHIVQLKKNWIVSATALIYRLYTVGLLTEWHYRTLMVEASGKGYRREEPQGAPRETSQVLAKVFSALRHDGVSRADVADALCLDQEEVDKLVFGLMLTGMSGGNQDSAGRTPPRGHLRVVQ